MELNKLPEEKNRNIYVGLLLGGIILGIATIALLQDILTIFSKSIEISAILIFRILLMVSSAYASASCFIGFFNMYKLEKGMSGKVKGEYNDFLLYARPLIEEVIRQRIVGEKIIEKMEALDAIEKNKHAVNSGVSSSLPRWAKFQFFAILIGMASVGLFVFLEAHPWELVPYTVLILSFLWYLVVGGYYGVLKESRSYYIPALFIAILPTMSMILRLQLRQYQVLYIVFLTIGLYLFLMVSYFEYIVTGRLPFGFEELKMEALKEARRRKLINENTYENYTQAEPPDEYEISAPPEVSEIDIISTPHGEIPKMEISSLLLEIEAKKQLKVEEMLSGISNDIEFSHYDQKNESHKPLITLSFDKIEEPLKKIFSKTLSRLHEAIWPRWLCLNGKKISMVGVIMMSLGIIALFALPGNDVDLFLELFFIGTVIAVAGYPLGLKADKKIFTLMTFPFILGFFTSMWAIIVLFQFFSISRFEEELQNVVLAYIGGIFLMFLNTFIVRIQKIRNTIHQSSVKEFNG
ncbi:MAG TPA: hypothetical protein VER35_02200 [Candidatus Limnocylindrales bacterium]|nr:hypothetical protein [Candidatus Limnocylindrales bacterium]